MPETPGFFPAGDGTPLYGVYHAPASRASCPPDADGKAAVRYAVVIAPPLFEERKSAYGALAQLARGLADLGIGVLRFDYRGSGESGGEAGGRRWSDLAADLDAACGEARKLSGSETVILIGARLSATLILTEADRLKPARIVAIAPILKGATEVRLWRLRSKMRSELGAQKVGEDARGPGAVPAARAGLGAQETGEDARGPVMDLDGFAVHRGFFEDLQRVDLSSASTPAEGPVLLIQISHRESALPDYERLASTLGPQAELACLKTLPFWERIENVETAGLQRRVEEFVLKG
jgi:pimeloyl-ACP methyl ester carboxylesterase